MSFIVLILGIFFVIKGSDFLVNGGSNLARRLKVSDLAVGLTVVAFGTSLPELFVNIFASANGDSGIALGNILGSNTANILLILGVSSIIFPLEVGRGTVWKEIPFSLLAVLILAVMANDWIGSQTESFLTRSDGLILLGFFLIFLYYAASIYDNSENIKTIKSQGNISIKKIIMFILLGLLLLAAGGKFIVDSAVLIAVGIGLDESTVGLTIVAVGTSIPELATSVTAAVKKNPEIAVGNVVGSNIFNIFFILGVSSIIKPLPIAAYNNVDILVVLLATVILFISMFTGKRQILDKWEGWVMFAMYIGYTVFLVTMR